MSCKITVVLPIYNVEKYLRRCLDSVLAQTCAEYEILCVNDCGTDNSMNIVRQYAQRYPDKIRVVESERNTGLGGARDKGIALAAGDYIAFVDSDDTISRDYLETYIRTAEETGADIVAGGSTRIAGDKRIAQPGVPEDPWYCWVNVSAWAKVFRTAFLRENGIDFRGVRTYEDAPFMYRCLAHEPKIAVIRHDGYGYYQNPGSITTSRGKDRMPLYEDYSRNLIRMYRETVFTEKDREILTYVMASQLITNLLYNGQNAGIKKMRTAYEKLDRFLCELEVSLKDNPFAGKKDPISEPGINKKATWAILKMRRIKLEKTMFYLAAVLPRMR